MLTEGLRDTLHSRLRVLSEEVIVLLRDMATELGYAEPDLDLQVPARECAKEIEQILEIFKNHS